MLINNKNNSFCMILKINEGIMLQIDDSNFHVEYL